MATTQHRYHVLDNFQAFLRFNDDVDAKTYTHADCPGICNPASQRNFPIIDTLLSIPFSLLHTMPRLASMFPISPYQQKLLQHGSEIIKLWWWDPTPGIIANSEKVAISKKRKLQSDAREPGPKPIARILTTFAQFVKSPTDTASTAQASKRTPQDMCAVKLPSSQKLFGTIPLVSLDRDELLFTSPDKGFAELARSMNTDNGLVASSQVTSASGETAGSEDLAQINDVEGFDIISWSETVVDCGPEPLPPLLALHSRGDPW